MNMLVGFIGSIAVGYGYAAGGVFGALTSLVAEILVVSSIKFAGGAEPDPQNRVSRQFDVFLAILVLTGTCGGAWHGGWRWGWAWALGGAVAGMFVGSLCFVIGRMFPRRG